MPVLNSMWYCRRKWNTPKCDYKKQKTKDKYATGNITAAFGVTVTGDQNFV